VPVLVGGDKVGRITGHGGRTWVPAGAVVYGSVDSGCAVGLCTQRRGRMWGFWRVLFNAEVPESCSECGWSLV
jgi:hypothetical protein